MTKRLEILFSLITPCNVFADVGCDHGYIAKAVLDNGLANNVIISDISKKSLSKAQTLLKNYKDKVKSFCCDGVKDFDGEPDQIFIAGMGGEEIVKIIKNVKFLPKKFVLCPHKNTFIVRELLLNLGYKLVRDFTFLADLKFYDAIVAEFGTDTYNLKQLTFGKENLTNYSNDFLSYLENQAKKYQKIIDSEEISSTQKKLLNEKLSLILEVLNERQTNLR